MKGIFLQSLSFYLVFLAYVFLIPIKANGTPPPPPQLVSPPNSSTDIPLAPRLEWAPSHGAISYQVEIHAILESEEYPIFFHETEDTYFDVPPGHLAVSMDYMWCVKAIYNSRNGPESKVSSQCSPIFSFITQKKPACFGECEGDDDCDGIPNSIEDIFKTSIYKKTLFVRPKKEKKYCSNLAYCPDDFFEPWKEFYTELFAGSNNARANIPAFVLAGIEVIVVGSSDNPYNRMRKFDYDPAKDDIDPSPEIVKRPPCDIMEIVYRKTYDEDSVGVVCKNCDDHLRKGRTWLRGYNVGGTRGYTWTWGTPGFTPSNKKIHGYFIPQIYPFPIVQYFKDGPYAKIHVAVKPETKRCDRPVSVEKCNQRSTNNLVNSNPHCSDICSNNPSLNIPCIDNTVEFNAISLKPDGEIEAFDIPVGVAENIDKDNTTGKPYTTNQVIARIVVHEMGHALLSANGLADHCSNPWCIMSGWTKDWEQRLFGSVWKGENGEVGVEPCDHSPGGSKDIRKVIENGGIHNIEHP